MPCSTSISTRVVTHHDSASGTIRTPQYNTTLYTLCCTSEHAGRSPISGSQAYGPCKRGWMPRAVLVHQQLCSCGSLRGTLGICYALVLLWVLSSAGAGAGAGAGASTEILLVLPLLLLV